MRYSRMLLKLGKSCKQYIGFPVRHPLWGGSYREKKLYPTGYGRVNVMVVVVVEEENGVDQLMLAFV
jgi:hypothetical protein